MDAAQARAALQRMTSTAASLGRETPMPWDEVLLKDSHEQVEKELNELKRWQKTSE